MIMIRRCLWFMISRSFGLRRRLWIRSVFRFGFLGCVLGCMLGCVLGWCWMVFRFGLVGWHVLGTSTFSTLAFTTIGIFYGK